MPALEHACHEHEITCEYGHLFLSQKYFKHERERERERERQRKREIHYVHSASLAYEDGIVFVSEPLQQGNETMADRLLVLVPHEQQMHAHRCILEQARKLGPDLTEMGAIKHT